MTTWSYLHYYWSHHSVQTSAKIGHNKWEMCWIWYEMESFFFFLFSFFDPLSQNFYWVCIELISERFLFVLVDVSLIWSKPLRAIDNNKENCSVDNHRALQQLQGETLSVVIVLISCHSIHCKSVKNQSLNDNEVIKSGVDQLINWTILNQVKWLNHTNGIGAISNHDVVIMPSWLINGLMIQMQLWSTYDWFDWMKTM